MWVQLKCLHALHYLIVESLRLTGSSTRYFSRPTVLVAALAFVARPFVDKMEGACRLNHPGGWRPDEDMADALPLIFPPMQDFLRRVPSPVPCSRGFACYPVLGASH